MTTSKRESTAVAIRAGGVPEELVDGLVEGALEAGRMVADQRNRRADGLRHELSALRSSLVPVYGIVITLALAVGLMGGGVELATNFIANQGNLVLLGLGGLLVAGFGGMLSIACGLMAHDIGKAGRLAVEVSGWEKTIDEKGIAIDVAAPVQALRREYMLNSMPVECLETATERVVRAIDKANTKALHRRAQEQATANSKQQLERATAKALANSPLEL